MTLNYSNYRFLGREFMEQTLHTGTTTVAITVKDAVVMATEKESDHGSLHHAQEWKEASPD